VNNPAPSDHVVILFLQLQYPERSMRIIAQVPHPQMKISIFSYNGKYIIEMEAGQYKQTYKIGEDSVQGLDEVKALCSPALINGTLQRFSLMHADFSEAFKTLSNS
jgi:hypothetical protein